MDDSQSQSFSPSIAAVRIISTFTAPLMLACVIVFPHMPVFMGVLVAWFFSFFVLYYKYHASIGQTALNTTTAISFIVLLLLVESIFFRWFFVGCSSIIFFFIAYWSEPKIKHALHIKEKPLRRMMMMLYVFNVYAFFIGIFAADVYFPSVPFIVSALLGGVYASIAAHMIWLLYFVPTDTRASDERGKIKKTLGIFKRFFYHFVRVYERSLQKKEWIYTLVVGIVMIEILLCIQFLPFGYLASGLLAVWLWYIMLLLIRFHLSPLGIVWKNQRAFLIANVVLYVLFLYSIRWI
ncbi:MAG: hypothetical protein WCW16_04435 [Candidatus Magasanikbacteria bacterium]